MAGEREAESARLMKAGYDVSLIERWPSLTPFVNGGLAAYLQGLSIYVPFAAVYYSPLLSHVRAPPEAPY